VVSTFGRFVMDMEMERAIVTLEVLLGKGKLDWWGDRED
jgi:hypothetical protein